MVLCQQWIGLPCGSRPFIPDRTRIAAALDVDLRAGAGSVSGTNRDPIGLAKLILGQRAAAAPSPPVQSTTG